MDDYKTVFCGNLSEELTEELLYELFLQVAPLERVKIPTDKDGRKSSFGFVTFKHEVSVPYAVEMLNGIKLFDRAMTVKPRKQNIQRTDSPMLMMQNPYDDRGQHYNTNPMMNQHLRFNEYGDPGSPQTNYEDILRLQQLGQMMQSYTDYANPYDSPYDNLGRHSNWHDREKDNFRGVDVHHRERDDYRDRNDHRDRGHNNRRHDNDRRDYPNHRNKRHDNHHPSGGYDRNPRRRY